MTSDFLDWFSQRYGAPFPVQLKVRLVKLDGDVWVSENLAGAVEHPPMVPGFLDEPSEYAMAGEWGRGVNSYAFYLVEKRDPHRRFFRLPSGGAYTRPEESKREILAYLQGYETWRRTQEGQLAQSLLIHNMGDSDAQVTLGNGQQLTLFGDEGAEAWWNALAQRLREASG